MTTTFQAETMLLDWSNTARGGPKIVLQLSSEEELEHFKALTLAKGKHAGQILMAVFALVDPSEAPPDPTEAAHRKPGPLCILAAKWCRDPDFQHWVPIQFLARTRISCTEEECRAIILDRLKIGSRREIDTVPAAKEAFEREFRKPFMAFMEAS